MGFFERRAALHDRRTGWAEIDETSDLLPGHDVLSLVVCRAASSSCSYEKTHDRHGMGSCELVFAFEEKRSDKRRDNQRPGLLP